MGANTTTCASLYASGVAEKPVNFTRNTLAVVVPKSNPAGIKSVYDLTKPGTKVVVAASSVPVGAYTVQVMNQMNLFSAIQPNVVSQETSDANVVSKVVLGQADAGFVYLSDYVIDPKDLSLIVVPAWAQPKITYSMCTMTKSPNQAAAQAWQDTVLSKKRSGDLRHGRLPAAAGARPDDRQGRAGEDVGGQDGHDHRHEPEGRHLGDVPGSPGEVQGRTRSSKLTVTVPAKAKTGTLTVTSPNGTATWKLITVS